MLLIISQKKKEAEILSETFYYMSILSYATTPKVGLSEISTAYKAVLIINPSSLPDPIDYVKRLRCFLQSIPIFAIEAEDFPLIWLEYFDNIFQEKISSPRLASQIINYSVSKGIEPIGFYRLAGFDVSSDAVGATFFDEPLGLTKTEAMIMRYLICCYPLPVCAKNILKYSFKSSRIPEESSVRTHISSINKKIFSKINRKIIDLDPGRGYYILTPEIISKGKLV